MFLLAICCLKLELAYIRKKNMFGTLIGLGTVKAT